MKKFAWPAAVVILLWAGVAYAGNPPATNWESVLASWSAPDIMVPRAASGEYSVFVESKDVRAGDSARIGIYLKNEQPLRSLVIPLVIRSIDPGAFCTSAIPSFDHTARINGYLNGIYNGEVIWPEFTNPWPDHPGIGAPRPLDYLSPDFILFAKGRILSENNLPAGDDGVPGSGQPSIVIDIVASNVAGRFEIDTAMIAPRNRLVFVLGQDNPVVGVAPEFTKGVVTILANDVAIGTEDSLDTGSAPTDTATIDPGIETGDSDPDSTAGEIVGDIAPPAGDSTSSQDTTSSDPAEVTRIVEKGALAIASDDESDQNPTSVIKSKGTAGHSPATEGAVTKVSLCSNFPNPFNAGTSIRYAVTEQTTINVSVYNLLGQKVATIAEGSRSPGEYFAIWNAADGRGNPVSSGIYFYRVQSGSRTEVGKMMLIR
ncbi:MAG: T9SS type A sorting domain-containing protein [candidate division Zixibacteria bacterium]|nr:T9SS type A sorting domain-containing protein [candidate division Zixibacteria bacterium]